MVTYGYTLTCCALARLALNHSPNHMIIFGCCSWSDMSRWVFRSHTLCCYSGLSDFDVVLNQKVLDLADSVFTAVKQTRGQHRISTSEDGVQKVLRAFGTT